MGAERRPGHQPEPIGRAPAYGQIRLDAPSPIEHLRVPDPTYRSGDLVGAHVLDEVRGVGAADLDLGEGRLVEERGALARGPVLGPGGGGPEAAGPTLGTDAGSPAGVDLVVDPFPAGLLPEDGAVRPMPLVHRRDPKRPARLPFRPGVGDRVVGLVHLVGPGDGVRGRAEVRAEPPDVHSPEIHGRLATGNIRP